MGKKQIHIPWTDEDKQFLKDNYMEHTATELSKVMGRTACSIRAEMGVLGLYRNKPWTEEDTQYLIDNYNIYSAEEISKKLKRSKQAIISKCHDLNISKKDLWMDSEIQYLKDNYNNKSTEEMAKVLGKSYNAVRIKSNRIGLKKYDYVCNESYFDNIDSEEKAYWLGFIAADGWTNLNEETNSGVVGIELQYGDIEHLIKFNKSIESNYKITDRWRPCKLSKYKDKLNHICVLRIYSLKLYYSLLRLGYTRDKTYTFSMPNIPKYLTRHYLRGFFDGDGCLSVRSKGYSNCSFVGASKKHVAQLHDILLNDFGVTSTFSTYKLDGCARMWKVDIHSNRKNKIKFLDTLYKNSTIYLDRKYKKYLAIKEGLAA